MKFKVSGVDVDTGEAVEPRILEADDQASAARAAHDAGISPTSIEADQPDVVEPLDSDLNPQRLRPGEVATAILLGWLVIVAMWLGGLWAMSAADGPGELAGLGFFIGGFLVMLTIAVARVRWAIEDGGRS